MTGKAARRANYQHSINARQIDQFTALGAVGRAACPLSDPTHLEPCAGKISHRPDVIVAAGGPGCPQQSKTECQS